jgi:hypothetical protein
MVRGVQGGLNRLRRAGAIEFERRARALGAWAEATVARHEANEPWDTADGLLKAARVASGAAYGTSGDASEVPGSANMPSS